MDLNSYYTVLAAYEKVPAVVTYSSVGSGRVKTLLPDLAAVQGNLLSLFDTIKIVEAIRAKANKCLLFRGDESTFFFLTWMFESSRGIFRFQKGFRTACNCSNFLLAFLLRLRH